MAGENSGTASNGVAREKERESIISINGVSKDKKRTITNGVDFLGDVDFRVADVGVKRFGKDDYSVQSADSEDEELDTVLSINGNVNGKTLEVVEVLSVNGVASNGTPKQIPVEDEDTSEASVKTPRSRKEDKVPMMRDTQKKKPSARSASVAALTDSQSKKSAAEQILAGMRERRKDIFGDQAQAMEGGWVSRGKSSAILRTFEIWWFFVGVLFAELRIRKEKDPVKITNIRSRNAKKLKEGLLRLGPTFIKLGQLLSTRVDVLPQEYIDELYELQDKVPGFSGEKAINIIETELGAPIEELYDAFDRTPIAAASLGQVHLAVLNGSPVAVKVQRQGLRELFDVDLKNLKVLAQIMERLDPKTDGTARDWVAIYEESAKLLYEEIDYFQEGKNADRFRNNFKNVKWVKVPIVYWDRTSTRILTMEYCPGVKISEKTQLAEKGIDIAKLAERSGKSYLTQLLRHGFFHCDPHPGNISVDVATGNIIYYDFGMMAEIDPEVKRGLVNLIFSVYEGDESEICDALELMGILAPNVDRVTVEKVGRYFLSSFRTNMMTERTTRRTKEEMKEELSSRLTAIGEDLVSVSDDQPFRFPATFAFVFRAFTTLEGIGKGLTKQYDLTKIAQPFLKELIDLKDGSAAASAAKSLTKKLGWRKQDLAAVVTQPRKVDYIAGVLKQIENGDLRVRSRVLESERSFKRLQLVQENLGFGIVASTFLNGALVLSATAEKFAAASRMMWLMALLTGVRVIIGFVKLQQLDKKLNKFTGRQ